MTGINIQEGKSVVHELTVGFFDSSMCGIENVVSAKGLISKEGNVCEFEITEFDISLGEFLTKYANLTFYSFGSFRYFNELQYVDICIAILMFGKYKTMFEDLQCESLPLESYLSTEYSNMKSGFQVPEWACRLNE